MTFFLKGNRKYWSCDQLHQFLFSSVKINYFFFSIKMNIVIICLLYYHRGKKRVAQYCIPQHFLCSTSLNLSYMLYEYIYCTESRLPNGFYVVQGSKPGFLYLISIRILIVKKIWDFCINVLCLHKNEIYVICAFLLCTFSKLWDNYMNC